MWGGAASFCHTRPILRSQVAKCQRPSSSLTKGRSCSPYTPSQESSCFLSCCQGNHQLHLCVTGLQGLAVPETNVTQKESDLKAREPRKGYNPALPQTRKQVWAWEFAQRHHPAGGILGCKALLCKHYIVLWCPKLGFSCAPHPESVARMRLTAVWYASASLCKSRLVLMPRNTSQQLLTTSLTHQPRP